MSTQPKRTARIEIRQAEISPYICRHGHTYGDGHWCDDIADHGPQWPSAVSQRPHYLVLLASNGQCLATSEVYANLTNARRAVGAWTRAFRQVGLDALVGAA